MKENKDLDNIIGKRDNSELIRQIHLAILSLDKRIIFRVFPIYIRYSKNDKVIAVLFLKGKFVNLGELVLGLNLDKNPKLKELKDAKYMKDSNLTYSYIIKNSVVSIKFVSKIIKLTI